ncbi:MAG: hypothetical protein WCV69_03380 [Patescibacteria group bacterium]|jgi:hypothetical protein
MQSNDKLYQLNKHKVELLKNLALLFNKNSVKWWLSDGFALEANLGEDSLVREHKDIDIIVSNLYLDKVEELLVDIGLDTKKETDNLLRAIDNKRNIIVDILHYNFLQDGSALVKMKKEIGRDIILPAVIFDSKPKNYFGVKVRTVRPELIYLDYKNSKLPKNYHQNDMELLEELLDKDMLNKIADSNIYLTDDEIKKL